MKLTIASMEEAFFLFVEKLRIWSTNFRCGKRNNGDLTQFKVLK